MPPLSDEELAEIKAACTENISASAERKWRTSDISWSNLLDLLDTIDARNARIAELEEANSELEFFKANHTGAVLEWRPLLKSGELGPPQSWYDDKANPFETKDTDDVSK